MEIKVSTFRYYDKIIASLGLTSSVLVGCGSTPSVNKSDEKYKEDEEQNDSSSSSVQVQVLALIPIQIPTVIQLFLR